MKTVILLALIALSFPIGATAAEKGPDIPSGTPMTIKTLGDPSAMPLAKQVACVCIEHNCCCGEIGKPCQWCGSEKPCQPNAGPAK